MTPPPKTILQEFKDLRFLWPFLRKYKYHVFASVALIPVISVMEMLTPIAVKWTIDEGVVKSVWKNVLVGSAVYLAIVVGQYIFRSGQSYFTSLAVHRMIRDLRRDLITHVLRLRCSFHDRNLSGTLVTRTTGDFDSLSESLNMGVLTAVIDLAVLAGSIIGLLYLNWQLALCSIAVLPLVAFLVAWFSKALKVSMMLARRKIAELNGYTQECLAGNTTIKLLGAEAAAQKKFEHLNEDYRKAQMGSVVLDAFMFSIIDGLTSITIGLLLFFSIQHFFGESLLTAGILVAFVQYNQQMFEPLKHLGNKMAMLQGAFTSIDRIFGVLRHQEFITGEQSLENLKGKIEFRDVSFSYGAYEKDVVLKGISFSVQPGESLALVGATGSGKSTIIKLFTKLYDGYDGEIFIDDKNLKDISGDELRKQMAIVPQDIILFHDTIRFNISLGAPGCGEEQIVAAAKKVGAHEFIERLPGKYDFVLREQGSNLSFGQRQLLAFARALCKDPKLIVLDEATSSVDVESEELIQQGIATLLKERTVIVIAHRLSTIRKCSKILVVEKGNLIEQGTHESLLASHGTYYQLHHALAK